MKNPERVAELLAELRELTENDFERHRIAVLERDLSAPPTVEVIDENRQKFNGIIYRQTSGGHFFTAHAIHRDVWIYHFGEIPEGYDIHHRDFDKTNNGWENLQLLKKSEHIKLHKNFPSVLPKERTCIVCGKKFSVGRFKSFCSQTCWQKSKGTAKQCPNCGKTFLAYTEGQQYCSHKCAATANSIAQKAIERICKGCGQKFSGRIGEFCSNKCYQRFYYRTNTIEKNCIVCGKPFLTSKCNQSRKTCSPMCAGTLRRSQRK